MQAATGFNGFDDMGSDFDTAPVVAVRAATLEEASGLKSERKEAPQVFTERCTRCQGTGRYHRCTEHGTVCLKCKGKGQLTFTSSPEARAKARDKRAEKKQADQDAKTQASMAAYRAFVEQHPDIAAWWDDNDFEFSVSLKAAAVRYGHLTDRQLEAARKCIAKLDAIKAERREREATAEAAPVLDLSKVMNAMNKAHDEGIKRPKMRLLAGDTGFVLSLAPEAGKWAGSLYAKSADGEYLGRITEGRFYPTREVSAELGAAIHKACQTPLESAVAYGMKTGTCSCCGRGLTCHVSIANGIGPICQGKFF